MSWPAGIWLLSLAALGLLCLWMGFALAGKKDVGPATVLIFGAGPDVWSGTVIGSPKGSPAPTPIQVAPTPVQPVLP